LNVATYKWNPTLEEQELPTLPEHPSSPPVFSGVRVTRSLVLYVYFVDRRLSSTLPKGTLGSVASLLAATLYQGYSDRNNKLWNIVSSERYILHMQVRRLHTGASQEKRKETSPIL
jgi:hypothetical protein